MFVGQNQDGNQFKLSLEKKYIFELGDKKRTNILARKDRIEKNRLRKRRSIE